MCSCPCDKVHPLFLKEQAGPLTAQVGHTLLCAWWKNKQETQTTSKSKDTPDQKDRAMRIMYTVTEPGRNNTERLHCRFFAILSSEISEDFLPITHAKYYLQKALKVPARWRICRHGSWSVQRKRIQLLIITGREETSAQLVIFVYEERGDKKAPREVQGEPQKFLDVELNDHHRLIADLVTIQSNWLLTAQQMKPNDIFS